MFYSIFLIMIILITISSLKWTNNYNNESLSLQSTMRLKGLSAIWIMIHHISQNIEMGIISKVLGSVGGLFTAIFLFLSGYGLMYSFKNKKDYFHTYYKRLFRVLIPYWLIDVLILIYYLMSKQKINVLNWILSLFAIQISPSIATYWFVSAIVIMYICFYLSFGLFKERKSHFAYITIFLYILMYSFVYIIILNLQGAYTGTIFSFFLGILWYEKSIKSHYNYLYQVISDRYKEFQRDYSVNCKIKRNFPLYKKGKISDCWILAYLLSMLFLALMLVISQPFYWILLFAEVAILFFSLKMCLSEYAMIKKSFILLILFIIFKLMIGLLFLNLNKFFFTILTIHQLVCAALYQFLRCMFDPNFHFFVLLKDIFITIYSLITCFIKKLECFIVGKETSDLINDLEKKE